MPRLVSDPFGFAVWKLGCGNLNVESGNEVHRFSMGGGCGRLELDNGMIDMGDLAIDDNIEERKGKKQTEKEYSGRCRI